jgi:hypothetical protein
MKFMHRFGIEPKSYKDSMQIFGFRREKELKLDSRLSAEEIGRMMPVKIPASQKALLYSAVKKLEDRESTLSDVIDEVTKSKSQVRWSLLSSLESLMKTGLFSTKPTTPEELVQEGKISIIDLKEARPEIQQMVVLKFAEELFYARKRGRIPPFLFVLEEAHNFCPERGLGEVASSRIIRTIASEGRKFGMGLMVVSQRPANVDKNILSQCNTQIILKVTNPNDLKAISESVEGMSAGVKEDIRDLPVGVAMIVGITDQPLIVDIRIRRSEHGGDAVRMQQSPGAEPDSSGPSYSMFRPSVSREQILLRHKGSDAVDFLKYPLWKISLKNKTIYLDGMTGEIVYERDGSLERASKPGGGLQMQGQPAQLSLSGIHVGPSFQQDSLKKRLSGLGIEPEKIELVFYPYWLVKKKGRKILVDAIHETIDIAASEAVRERV